MNPNPCPSSQVNRPVSPNWTIVKVTGKSYKLRIDLPTLFVIAEVEYHKKHSPTNRNVSDVKSDVEKTIDEDMLDAFVGNDEKTVRFCGTGTACVCPFTVLPELAMFMACLPGGGSPREK